MTTQTFEMYENGPGAPQSGPKASQAMQQAMEPGGVSLLCLSCHDGSVAVNSYGNPDWQLPQSVGVGGIFVPDRFTIGKDGYLGNHHPIGFNYDAVAAVDTEVRQADDADMGTAGKVRAHLFGEGNAMMECATCHSVHNKGNTGETLLWRSDTNSQLCLTCHDKGDYPGMLP
jgi:predicted CXXCH cytochrome family protein